MDWLGPTKASSRPVPQDLSSDREGMWVSNKGRGACAVVQEEPMAMNAIVILNRWGSIHTLKLHKDRKGLIFRPVIQYEESILPNLLPPSPSHLPSLTLKMLIPETERGRPGPPTWQASDGQTEFWLSDQEHQAEDGQDTPSLFISTLSPLPLWKTTASLC